MAGVGSWRSSWILRRCESSGKEMVIQMKRSLTLLLGLALLVPFAWPQASTSSVSGTVRDPSGAVIPNATTVIVGAQTDVTLTTKTNDAGVYFFPAIIAGSYRHIGRSSGNGEVPRRFHRPGCAKRRDRSGIETGRCDYGR